MAFRILNSEELSLLDDKQRMQYEKEYELFQQRQAFIERMEELESVYIEPYEAKLVSIPVLEEREQKAYEKPEYVMSLCEPIEIHDMEIAPYKKIDKVKPELPFVQECADVAIEHIHKVEAPQAHVPHVMSTSIKKEIDIDKLKNDLDYTPDSVPNVVMPDIEIRNITVSTVTQVSIPNVEVCNVETILYVKPEKKKPGLPMVEIPTLTINDSQKIDCVQAKVPDVVRTDVLPTLEFTKPEQKRIDLPRVTEPNVNISEFKKPTGTVSEIPEFMGVNIQPKEFRKPKQKTPEVPSISKVEVRVMNIERSQSKKTELPKVAEASIEIKAFEKPEKLQMNLNAQEVPSVVTRTFVKPQKDIVLPATNEMEIPNAYERLKELLLC